MAENAGNVFDSADFAAVPPETKSRLREAFEESVQARADALRPEIESAVRKELAERVGYDMNRVIDSAETMIKENLSANFEDNKIKFAEYADGMRDAVVADERKREALSEVTMESLRAKGKKLDEQISKVEERRAALMEDIEKFEDLKARQNAEFGAAMDTLVETAERVIAETLAKEVDELVEDRRMHQINMKESRERTEKFVAEETARATGKHERAAALLEAERESLASSRSEILGEARREFLETSTERAERIIQKTLRENIELLREDIQESKENQLGRDMFERFAAVYETRGDNPNMQMTERNNAIESLQEQLDETKQAVRERDRAIAAASRRMTILEMTSTLSGGQKDFMESLLENVPTNDLESAFKKFLPKVIENSGTPDPIISSAGATGVAPVPGIGAAGASRQDTRIRIAEGINHAPAAQTAQRLSVKNGDRRESLLETSQPMFGPNVSGAPQDDLAHLKFLVGKVTEGAERPPAARKGD